jgi:lambda repressor-like predicted transcriptional regulator
MASPAQQVALWSAKVREAIARRDDAIRSMRAEGYSLRAIAAVAGLSPSAVVYILRNAEQ